jgi:DNA-binding NtrC family response regulator
MGEVDLVQSRQLRDTRNSKLSVIEIKVQVDPTLSYGQLKEEVVSSFEIQFVKLVLDQHSDNLSSAAKALRMDRKHLYDMAIKHGIRKRPQK